GGGKSLCFQVWAVFQHEQNKAVIIVISPLVALIRDQVKALIAKRVQPKVIQSIYRDSRPALIYVTPERIQKRNEFDKALRPLYRQRKLVRFVVDEAHCISTWDDFRDSYGGLHILREGVPSSTYYRSDCNGDRGDDRLHHRGLRT
ncbi:hypothetical protein DFH07DRAFT_1022650, partial [Mycena maculata]